MYDEVEKVIKKLQKKESVGWDNIRNEIIKNKSLTMLLRKFFQKCFDSGLVPSIWLKSVITPIPKPGMKDPYRPLNYRGISLVSYLSKVYSSILNKRISAFFFCISYVYFSLKFNVTLQVYKRKKKDMLHNNLYCNNCVSYNTFLIHQLFPWMTHFNLWHLHFVHC